MDAADALYAFRMGEDNEAAQHGAILLAEFLLLASSFLRGDGQKKTKRNG